MRRRSSIHALLLLAAWIASSCGSGGGSPDGGGPVGPPSEPVPVEAKGFVISSFGYLFPEVAPGDCPGGFNLSPVDPQPGGGPPIADNCADPEAVQDPGFKTLAVSGSFTGFDLDEKVSTSSSPGRNECAHDDFSGPAGEGLDFQLWRAIGCVRGFQPGEISETVIDNSVRDGSSTILIEVAGVDDAQNDDSVEVRVFASTDAPPVGSDGELLHFGSLSVHEDARYHGTAGEGRIVDGVLTAGPMDVRWRFNIQIVETDLSLHDAYVRIETHLDGTASGQLSGFTPVDEMYEIFGRQAGPAGAAALGYTCTGLYSALKSQADGDYDPDTGSCASLSVAYRFDAVPAFVVR